MDNNKVEGVVFKTRTNQIEGERKREHQVHLVSLTTQAGL
jgi:hypothetical protein